MSLRSWTACCLFFASMAVAHAATHEVQVISFRFEPRNLTIQPGDTVVWRNTGGDHNVIADDESFTNGPPSSSGWTFSRTFNALGTVGYYCQPHGGPGGAGMSGAITVAGGAAPFAINYGTSGTWFNPATTGQGFFVEVVPSLNLLIFSWFTWSNTTTGDHDWLTGLGPITGDNAIVDLRRSSGGRFNNPAAVSDASAGSATIRFTDCNNGTVTFQRSDNGTSGTIPIQRLTVAPAACTSPAAQ